MEALSLSAPSAPVIEDDCKNSNGGEEENAQLPESNSEPKKKAKPAASETKSSRRDVKVPKVFTIPLSSPDRRALLLLSVSSTCFSDCFFFEDQTRICFAFVFSESV